MYVNLTQLKEYLLGIGIGSISMQKELQQFFDEFVENITEELVRGTVLITDHCRRRRITVADLIQYFDTIGQPVIVATRQPNRQPKHHRHIIPTAFETLVRKCCGLSLSVDFLPVLYSIVINRIRDAVLVGSTIAQEMGKRRLTVAHVKLGMKASKMI